MRIRATAAAARPGNDARPECTRRARLAHSEIPTSCACIGSARWSRYRPTSRTRHRFRQPRSSCASVGMVSCRQRLCRYRVTGDSAPCTSACDPPACGDAPPASVATPNSRSQDLKPLRVKNVASVASLSSIFCGRIPESTICAPTSRNRSRQYQCAPLRQPVERTCADSRRPRHRYSPALAITPSSAAVLRDPFHGRFRPDFRRPAHCRRCRRSGSGNR